MKLASKYFYNIHKNEISKYIKSDSEYLNILSEKSNIPKGVFTNVLKVKENQSINSLLNNQYSNTKFDLIILTDIFELSEDIYQLLLSLKNFLKSDGVLILSSVNPVWHSVSRVAEKLQLKHKPKVKSYITPKKIENILKAANFQRVKKYNRVYIPFKILGIGTLLNFFLYTIFPFLNMGIRNYLIYTNIANQDEQLSKSILIPAKNEEGNLEELVDRIPAFKSAFELIIICGESKDKTYEKSIEIQQKYKAIDITVLKQSKNGKANAIWEGLEYCKNEVIAILDSDLSVDPETLVDFFEIIEYGNADFVNGTRLIYQMEKGSMQMLNKFGNRFFQLLISKLISTQLSDSLCGTKVFKKSNQEFIKKWQNIMYFDDPFCDFDLIFSSAYSGKRIAEIPVHYRSRKYGTTNISRFRDGWKLLFYFLNSYFLFKTDFHTTKNFNKK
jgi:hypothetical protein